MIARYFNSLLPVTALFYIGSTLLKISTELQRHCKGILYFLKILNDRDLN